MRRIKHAKTAPDAVTPSVAYTDWNDWLVDETGAVIDLEKYFRLADAGITSVGLSNWGIIQSFATGSPATGWDSGGIYASALANWATDNSNMAIGLKGEAQVVPGVPVGGYPSSSIVGVLGYAASQGANSQLSKLVGGSFEARVYGKAVAEVYGIMVQASDMAYQPATTIGSVRGIYADAYTSDIVGGIILTVGTLYGAELRTFGKTNNAGSVSQVTKAYGLFSSLYNQQAPSSTSTIVDAYNIYLTGERPGGIGAATYGPITNYYHLYLEDVALINAGNKWSIYNVNGIIYSGGKVGIGTPTPAASAMLEIASTVGALLIPRMTTGEKNALTPVEGMIVYDATLKKFQGYENAAWASFI